MRWLRSLSWIPFVPGRGKQALLTGSFLCLWGLSGPLMLQGADENPQAGAAGRAQGSKIETSPETTVVTEQLTPDGLPDFPAALNAQMSAGVTPETNAAVLLWTALGPRPENVRREFHEAMAVALGMDPLPEEGVYLANIGQWLQEQPTPPADLSQQVNALYEELNRARRSPWQANDHPELAAWLQRNAIPLKSVSAAVKKPHYFRPVIVNHLSPSEFDDLLLAALLPDVQTYREIGRLLSIRATQHLGAGRLEAAQQDLLDGHRLARHVARGWTLIDSLVGHAMEALISDAANALLVHPQFTAAQARTYRQQLEQLGPVQTFEQLAWKIDVSERYMALQVIVALADRPFTAEDAQLIAADGQEKFFNRLRARGINYNRALRQINQTYDQLLSAYKLPERAERLQTLGEHKRQLAQQLTVNLTRSQLAQLLLTDDTTRGETLGKLCSSLLVPAIIPMHIACERSLMRYEALRTGLALAEYRRTHERYPADLQALIPKYLPQIPVDLFSGQPLVYQVSADGQTMKIYSVGDNGKDDNGVRFIDRDINGQLGDDLGIIDPIPQPPAQANEADANSE